MFLVFGEDVSKFYRRLNFGPDYGSPGADTDFQTAIGILPYSLDICFSKARFSDLLHTKTGADLARSAPVTP